MPVYLLHGFRWPREGFTGVRVHAIVHNLEDCSVEYIQNENSKRDLLGSFRKLYPELMLHLDNPKTGQSLEFIEQYDPEDEYGPHSVSQPYAFVGDRVITIASGSMTKHEVEGQKEKSSDSKGKQRATSPTTANTGSARSSGVLQSTGRSEAGTSQSTTSSKVPSDAANSLNLMNALSVNVEEVMSSGPAVTPQAWEALAELRDKIAEGQKIGWWVVYNGDPDRGFDELDSDSGYEGEEMFGEEDYYEEDVGAEGARTPTQDQATLPIASIGSPTQIQQEQGRAPQPRSSSLKSPTQQTHGSKHREGRSQHKATTSTSSTASGPRPGTGGREPPPVTPPSVPLRTNPKPTQVPTSTAGPGKPVNLPEPARKPDNIPEPPKAKEVAKKEGLRKKFFGKKP